MRALGLSWDEVGAEFGISGETTRKGLAYHTKVKGPGPGRKMAALDDILEIPVREYERFVAPGKPAKMETALLYSDTHFPYEDPRALSIVEQIAAELQPDLLAHLGDIMDCYTLSDFDRSPQRKHTLQDEIDMAREHLARMATVCPKSRRILLEGNHEDRLRRTLWRMKGSAESFHSLRIFQEMMVWPELLKLRDIGWEWYGVMEQTKAQFLPKFILKHGTTLSQFSAYTARKEWRKYGKSGASGHTHRIGWYMNRDHNGNHAWIEIGCTCTLEPEWMQDPNWQQGCAVVTFEPKTGAFGIELVYIHNGLAVWRGRTYRA